MDALDNARPIRPTILVVDDDADFEVLAGFHTFVPLPRPTSSPRSHPKLTITWRTTV